MAKVDKREALAQILKNLPKDGMSVDDILSALSKKTGAEKKSLSYFKSYISFAGYLGILSESKEVTKVKPLK